MVAHISFMKRFLKTYRKICKLIILLNMRIILNTCCLFIRTKTSLQKILCNWMLHYIVQLCYLIFMNNITLYTVNSHKHRKSMMRCFSRTETHHRGMHKSFTFTLVHKSKSSSCFLMMPPPSCFFLCVCLVFGRNVTTTFFSSIRVISLFSASHRQ